MRARAAFVAALSTVWILAGTAVAMAQASPEAGGAQPVGSSGWNFGFIKFLIVGVPLIVTAVLWVVLARKKTA